MGSSRIVLCIKMTRGGLELENQWKTGGRFLDKLGTMGHFQYGLFGQKWNNSPTILANQFQHNEMQDYGIDQLRRKMHVVSEEPFIL